MPYRSGERYRSPGARRSCFAQGRFSTVLAPVRVHVFTNRIVRPDHYCGRLWRWRGAGPEHDAIGARTGRYEQRSHDGPDLGSDDAGHAAECAGTEPEPESRSVSDAGSDEPEPDRADHAGRTLRSYVIAR